MKGFGILIRGCVQGIGFRPFIYRLASKYNGIRGRVKNIGSGAYIEVFTDRETLESFISDIKRFFPDRGFLKDISIKEIENSDIPDGFGIVRSSRGKVVSLFIPPDMAMCEECEKEFYDPNSRRFLHPFTSCGRCGARFSIIEALPFDRERTSMNFFPFCEDCLKEYESPDDRRFHIQTFSCKICGPYVYVKGLDIRREEAFKFIADRLKEGRVVAIKGVSGFLISSLMREDLVERVRSIKRRPHKPLACMFPSIEKVKEYCYVSNKEEELLKSVMAPIVLLRAKDRELFPNNLSPDNDYIGVMLPYNGIFKGLFYFIDEPLVMTSANISSEPIIYDDEDELETFSDFVLTHNRKIQTPLDDSVVFVERDYVGIIRRSRGYVPTPIILNRRTNRNVLGVGAHKKVTFSIAEEDYIITSQEIGELDNVKSLNRYRETLEHFFSLFDFVPDVVVSDLHPNYETSLIGEEIAEKYSASFVRIQHHRAHILSVCAENDIYTEPVLGIAFDGTGYGDDGALWGGEFFVGPPKGLKRVASFSPFPLPSGEMAIKEPVRIAFSLLYSVYRDVDRALGILSGRIDRNLAQNLAIMIDRSINSPYTSSVGRLFDAVSSICGLSDRITYEGQAAIRLERAALEGNRDSYEVSVYSGDDGVLYFDTKKLILSILDDLSSGVDVSVISSKFHNTIAKFMEFVMSIYVGDEYGIEGIILSGGVFQNRYLLRRIFGLMDRGYKIFLPKTMSVNDESISIGQCFFGILNSY